MVQALKGTAWLAIVRAARQCTLKISCSQETMSFSWERANTAVSTATSVSLSKGNSGLCPQQELLALPYPLDAVLEPQLPPHGLLLLEQLLQGLRQRRRWGDLWGTMGQLGNAALVRQQHRLPRELQESPLLEEPRTAGLWHSGSELLQEGAGRCGLSYAHGSAGRQMGCELIRPALMHGLRRMGSRNSQST